MHGINRADASRQSRGYCRFSDKLLSEVMMRVEDLDLGDVVYAAHRIINDGSMPDSGEGEVLAEAGTRGVIVMKGHIEEDQTRHVFLVRFEDAELNLGRPIGCWVEDLVAKGTLN
jgi:nitrogen fixation protein NifZ